MMITVQPIPMAQTGPSPAVEFNRATVRQISPRITVTADAMIGGAAPFQAAIIASTRLSYSCSSSRYRLMSNRA